MKQVLLNDGEECFITQPEDFIPEIFQLFLCQNGGDTGSVKSFSQIGLQASGKMKSVGNGGILNGSLQMLHIHVLFVTPLGTSHMA